MAEASDRARRRLQPDHRAIYAVRGAIWILGRGAHRGPGQAETGLRGRSVLRRWAYILSVLAGFGAIFALEGALVRAGASASVVGIFEASAPILVHQ
jgi:hypothetical protein